MKANAQQTEPSPHSSKKGCLSVAQGERERGGEGERERGERERDRERERERGGGRGGGERGGGVHSSFFQFKRISSVSKKTVTKTKSLQTLLNSVIKHTAMDLIC